METSRMALARWEQYRSAVRRHEAKIEQAGMEVRLAIMAATFIRRMEGR